jgi:hypothetical protein
LYRTNAAVLDSFKGRSKQRCGARSRPKKNSRIVAMRDKSDNTINPALTENRFFPLTLNRAQRFFERRP